MKKSDKRIFWTVVLSVILTVLLTGSIYFLVTADREPTLGGRSSGGQSYNPEVTIFSGLQNTASWSADGNHDHIVYESEPVTSVSIGDIVIFHSASPSMRSPLAYDTYYYVVSVSYDDTDYDDRFEVSTTKGGTNVGTIASSFYSDYTMFVYEEFIETGEMDVTQYEGVNFTIFADEGPSLSFDWVCSIMSNAPDWYATQSITNRWEYVDAYDVKTATSIDGNIGIGNLNGADEARMFQVFTPNCRWLFVRSQNYASGSVDVRGIGF